MHRTANEVTSFFTDAHGSECVSRFKVTVAEDEVDVGCGVRKEFKLRASLKLATLRRSSSSRAGRRSFSPLRNFSSRTIDSGTKKSVVTGLLAAEAKRLENQVRFITEKISGDIQIENCPQMELVETLRELGYDPDPILVWEKESIALLRRGRLQEEDDETAVEADLHGLTVYDYLLEMPLRSLTRERRDALLEERNDAKAQVAALRSVSFENTSVVDLDAFFANLLGIDDSDEPNDSSSEHSGETSSRNTESTPSTSASSAVPNIGARRGFWTTGGAKQPRVADERASGDGGRPVAARPPQGMLGKMIHCWFHHDPHQHSDCPRCSNGAGDDTSTAASSRHNRPTAASSLLDHQFPSASAGSQRERAADAKKGFNAPDKAKNARTMEKAARENSPAPKRVRFATDLEEDVQARSAPPPPAGASSAFMTDYYDLDTDSDC